MPKPMRTNKTDSSSLILMFLYVFSYFVTQTAARCQGHDLFTLIPQKYCPKAKDLTFFPLNPNPIVVYGNWRGKNADGIEFKSYKAPDGVTHTTGRRGTMLQLLDAMLVCDSNIIRCQYLLKESSGEHKIQSLISTVRVPNIDENEASVRLEL